MSHRLNNCQTIAVSAVVIGIRLRTTDAYILEIMASMQEHGLLQPIILGPDDKLIDGAHRLEAAKRLGWDDIPYVRKDTLDRGHVHMLEVEANIRRKEMSWQEKAKGILLVHNFKSQQAALLHDRWTADLTSAMLGVPRGSMHMILLVAREIVTEPSGDVARAETLFDAFKLLTGRKLRLAEIESARQLQANRMPTIPDDEEEDTGLDEVLIFNNGSMLHRTNVQPISFDKAACIDLSFRCIHGDAIAVMREMPDASVDHIITDPPYALDMDSILVQKSIVGVRDEHEVWENVDLMIKALPEFYRITKPHSWVVLWTCPDMVAELLVLGKHAGFAVQAWPNIWVKPSAQNRQAHLLFTKNYEVCVILRREAATLRRNNINAAQSYAQTIRSDKALLGNHPFIKPLPLWLDLMSVLVHPGQSVLDPFAGVGSCIQAIIAHRAEPIAIELVASHFNSLLFNVQAFYRDIHGSTLQFLHADAAPVPPSESGAAEASDEPDAAASTACIDALLSNL